MVKKMKNKDIYNRALALLGQRNPQCGEHLLLLRR